MDRNTTTLQVLQEKIYSHFSSLATDRASSGFPLFALEHGLESSEIQHVNSQLRSRQEARQSLEEFWLLWVVYSCEAGYGYTGAEYWRSFEEHTPNWLFQDRSRIKQCFERFRDTFGGVSPSGAWAQHFSIIAWPITHALLPRDIQFQFVRLLYHLRLQLISNSSDAISLGRLLSSHASQTSKRFQTFLEQEELAGQIVVALLQEVSIDGAELIYPPTHKRIVADLNRVGSSREWLLETKRVVQDRFKGIGRGLYNPFPRTPTTDPSRSILSNVSLLNSPELFLRYDGKGTWSTLVQLKSFKSVASNCIELKTFLDRSRCRLNGGIDWKPAGWLLSGTRVGALKHWPNAEVPLIQFERENPLMNRLLQSECRLKPGRFGYSA